MTDPTPDRWAHVKGMIHKGELTAAADNHETPEEMKVFRDNEYERLTPSRGFRR